MDLRKQWGNTHFLIGTFDSNLLCVCPLARSMAPVDAQRSWKSCGVELQPIDGGNQKEYAEQNRWNLKQAWLDGNGEWFLRF